MLYPAYLPLYRLSVRRCRVFEGLMGAMSGKVGTLVKVVVELKKLSLNEEVV